VAQAGASGAAVVSPAGKLIGIIVTASTEENTAERNLRAITLSYINRAFSAEAGLSLHDLRGNALDALTARFNAEIAPKLKGMLVDEIEHPTPRK
jgi:hypothetical protein